MLNYVFIIKKLCRLYYIRTVIANACNTKLVTKLLFYMAPCNYLIDLHES